MHFLRKQKHCTCHVHMLGNEEKDPTLERKGLQQV
jgi:hypothetical protein